MSVIDDINKKRTRQSVGEAVQTVKSGMGNMMGDQASARVSAGKQSGLSEAARGNLNPTAEQETVAKMLVNPAAPQATAAPQAAAVPQVSAPAVEPVTTYTDIAKRIYPELDAEAVAKREKQLRTKKKVAAIGDAISALANMYYTNKSGVNAYDPSATLSGRAKERYDKFLSDVKEYEDAHKASMLRGAEKDAAAAEQRRLEQKADERYQEQKETAAATAKQAQKNWEKQFAYNKEKDEKEFNHEVAKAAAADATKRYITELNAGVKQDYYNNLAKYKGAQATAKTLGKALPFPTDGEPLVIYENVWNTSAPQVMAILKDEGVETPVGWIMQQPTPTQITSWVKEHWRKSPSATALMRGLAQITPATLPVQPADEDYSQYAVAADEDYSQYITE